jgi:D-amino peptidase
MKVYLSADIEGTAGVALWDQAEKGKPDYLEAREQMTAEVAAACEGLLDGGATEVWVQDAHGTTINVIASRLPERTRLVRGWSGHPFFMLQALDETFGAAVLIGYHSRAGGGGNPLEHTMSTSLSEVRINDRPASEFLVHAYAAELLRVPVVFLSGDEALCREVESVNPAIGTAAVLSGVGDSTVSLHPAVAVRAIKDGVKRALAGDLERCRVPLPERFVVDLRFRKQQAAYKSSFYPGSTLTGPTTVRFTADAYYDVLRMFLFALYM